jgi:hypothetical protein
MLYTIFWVILFLMGGGTNLTFGSMEFWALVVAIIADVFWFGLWQRGWKGIGSGCGRR